MALRARTMGIVPDDAVVAPLIPSRIELVICDGKTPVARFQGISSILRLHVDNMSLADYESLPICECVGNCESEIPRSFYRHRLPDGRLILCVDNDEWSEV